jgi:AraC family transcriptional regulator, exoenzyme S synthesis regulatory protein ExsA
MDIINLPQDILPGGGNTSENIVFYDYSPPRGYFKGKAILHKHAISLVISGEKTMHFAEKTVYTGDTEFHLLSAGNCVASMNLAATTLFRSLLIFFDNDLLTNFFIKYASRVNKIKDVKKQSPALYLSFAKDPFITNFINSLLLLLQSKTQLSFEMRLLKLEELWLYLLEKYPTRLLSFQPDANKQPDDLTIRKVVETSITNNISIAELSFLCHMSISTFKRRFIKLYGKAPNEWFLQARMKLAKELLLYHNKKPSQIYDKVGYESHSSFSQAFRKVFGKTPGEYLNDQPQFLND